MVVVEYEPSLRSTMDRPRSVPGLPADTGPSAGGRKNRWAQPFLGHSLAQEIPRETEQPAPRRSQAVHAAPLLAGDISKFAAGCSRRSSIPGAAAGCFAAPPH